MTVAWMHGCHGRTILLRIGNAEVAAAIANEHYGLFDSATAINKRLTASYNRND